MKATSIIAALVVLATLSPVGHADELPDAPIAHISVQAPQIAPQRDFHFSRRLYIAEVSVVGAAMAADYITTVQNVNRPGIHESNSFLGPHPSNGRVAAYGAAEFAVAASVAWIAEHNSHKPVRVLGRMLIAGSTINHGQAAAYNAISRGSGHDLPIALF